jgi:hypothetical protein
MNAMRPDQIQRAIEKQRREDIKNAVLVCTVCIVLSVLFIIGVIINILG